MRKKVGEGGGGYMKKQTKILGKIWKKIIVILTAKHRIREFNFVHSSYSKYY